MKEKNVVVVISALVIVLSLLLPCEIKAQDTEKTVRVGYYPVANYQEVRDDGTYFGFSYDYFMQIQKYARWNYEFVEASYAECLQMLLDGEIDVMSGLAKTQSRESQMIFSKYSISNSQNKLYARNENKNLFYESYDTFDGCKVAVIKGMLTQDLDEYCLNHDFGVETVYFDSMKEIEEALMSGEVELLYGASITNSSDTKIVARMDKVPLYYATAIGETEIAEEIDDALRKIGDNNPNFYTQMSEKYMINGANATATFTREELAYIQSGQEVYVIMNAYWAPITWYDTKSGQYKGIFVDVLERMEEYSGLNFVFCTEDEFNEMAVQKPEIVNNVLAILADDNSWASQQSVMMTNHVADSSVVMVTKTRGAQKVLEKNQVIALPNRFYIGYVMKEGLKDKTVVYYDTVQECLDAVNKGKADATYVNELVSTYYLSMLEYSELFATANSGYYENLAFAVNKDSDAPLLSILDKSLLCLGTNDIEQIIVQNSIAQQRVSLKGLYYSNPAMIILIVILVAGIIFGVLLWIHFITSRKKRIDFELKKEMETSNARTEFFMMISHELRTPLNAIVGYLDLAAEQGRKNGQEMEYIKRSQVAARQLTAISGDMLDYTKITSDTVELKEELFDLKNIILNVDQNISLNAVKKDLEYQFTVQDIIHEYVVGDRLRITQIMQNILSNAVKFTEDGGKVTACVSEKVLDERTVALKFVCKDTGKGMSQEFLEKVCAPFNQSDKSYSRTHGGLGLGLYLTKYFVTAMKGSFEVQSTLGEGTTFTVELPLKRPSSEQIFGQNVDCSHVRAIIGGVNPEENQQIKELLKRLKIKSDAMTDTEKVMKRIRLRMGGNYEYSLCILDDSMLELDDRIVENINSMEKSPTIFLFSNNIEKIQQLSLNKKVNQVLYKPIFQSVLFDAIMNTFGEYKVEENQDDMDLFKGIHAMIVEDNLVNADILKRILKKAQIETTLCENGQIAVDTFQNSKLGTFQIIFMDIQMPVLDGYEAAKKIRQSLGKEGESIPIVAVSANAFPEDIEKSLVVGMNEHISKPVSAPRIYEVMRKYCLKD